MEAKKQTYQQTLMQTIRFDENDLIANRNGRVTARQTGKLDDQRTMLGCLALLASMALCGVLFFTYGRHIDNMRFVSAIIVVAISIPVFILRSYNYHQEMNKPQVSMVEGIISLVISGGKTTYYFVRINDTKLEVSKEIFLLFKNHDPYRIYYLSGSRTLLSVEWLGAPDPAPLFID